MKSRELTSINIYRCGIASPYQPPYCATDEDKIPDLADFRILKNVNIVHTQTEALL